MDSRYVVSPRCRTSAKVEVTRDGSRRNSGVCSSAQPKLRSACNECHSAKVRCTGEKDGCQRCENLDLQCVFAISRLGKNPGKRARIHKSGANALSGSVDGSAASSTSSEQHQIQEQRQSTPRDADLVAAGPTTSRPHPHTVTTPTESSSGTSAALSDTIAVASSHMGHSSSDLTGGMHLFSCSDDFDPMTIDPELLGMSPCGIPPMLSPGCDVSFLNTSSVFSAQSTDPSQAAFDLLDCDMDAPVEFVNCRGQFQDQASAVRPLSKTYSGFGPADSAVDLRLVSPLPELEHDGGADPCAQLLQLIFKAERCLIRVGISRANSSVDMVLASNRRFLDDMQRLQSEPRIGASYTLLMLSSVALSKCVNLLIAAYRNLTARFNERQDQIVAGGRLVSFGAFEMSVDEQRQICFSIVLREVKRARQCLAELVAALAKSNPGTTSAGRHEDFHVELEKRLTHIAASLTSAGAL